MDDKWALSLSFFFSVFIYLSFFLSIHFFNRTSFIGDPVVEQNYSGKEECRPKASEPKLLPGMEKNVFFQGF